LTPRRERKGENMHYANGREAKNGDKVVLLGYGGPTVGILYDAQAGNDYCNGKIAVTKPGDPCPNLKECLHLDDVLALFPADEPFWPVRTRISCGECRWFQILHRKRSRDSST